MSARRAIIDPRALFAPLFEFKRLALAVSGGPDSLALLLLADKFAEQSGRRSWFVVYSVDHGLRAEAADEAAFVVSTALDRGFDARVLRWDEPKPETGVQEAARMARYRLFAEAMKADGASVLVTAHHLHDQAETVLMRLAHGSGIEGLRGMDYLSEIGELKIVRPLLAVDPGDLRAIVDEAGLTPVTDPSNSDIDYERVRWRKMLPRLAELGLDARRLATFAGRMRDAESALLNMTAQAMSLVTFQPGSVSAELKRDALMSLPRAIGVRVIARILDRVGGGQKPHALAAVEALTDRLIRERVATTLHGCIVRGGGKTIRISREPGRAAARQSRAEPTDA